MKNQPLLLCLVYGLSGGLNPTEPFKSLPGGRLCCWTFRGPLHSCSINCGCSWRPGTRAQQALSSLLTLVSRDVGIQSAGCDPLASVQNQADY
jgi:hypothetical protein